MRYHALNHTWPPESFIPETPGWRKLFEHRLRQVTEIEDDTDRFEGFAQTLSAGVLQKNFTEHGFGLTKAPEPLMEDLRRAIREGVEKGPRLESHINAITEPRPWFIDRPDLTQRVLDELQDLPEQWVGFPLTPVTAYGFRLYRNTSRLHVHVDKTETHVISFILHIDSSDDADPWPILIEDLHGTTHEVTLKSGDLLFYESSKCFHGRPRPLNGSWYSSVFVHYYPTFNYKNNFDKLAKVNRIPPSWKDKPTTQYEIPLQMHGTTMEEPMCPNYWCNTKLSKKWSGPGETFISCVRYSIVDVTWGTILTFVICAFCCFKGEEGVVLNPDGTKRALEPLKYSCEDKNSNCALWASWDTNECDTNSGYMKVNCPKSCGLCMLGSMSDEL